MKVIIAWDGDHIGREVGRASLADDVDGLRRISQAIDLGNRIWSSWVTMNNGSIISFGGDEGRAEIPAEKLADLPRIRNQYASAVGSSVSVGVGTKLSEADRALMAGKLQGGDKIVLWTPEVDELIAKLQKQNGERTEADKLSDEYLKKADQPGFKKPGTPDAPGSSGAPEGSPTQAIQQTVDDGPPPPEATSSGDDLAQFHDAAQAQDAKDKGQPATQGQDQVKTQIVQVLQQLKQQMPILEQVKATNPDTYQSVMNLAQAVIMMARQMNGDDPNQEGPREKGDRAASQNQVEVPLDPEEQEKSGDKKEESSSSSDTKKSETLIKAEKKPDENWHNCEEHGHCWGSGETAEHCLLCGATPEDMKKDTLEANVTPPQRHHLQLPVGTHKDPGTNAARQDAGAIKIQHTDNGTPGKQGWIEARAGQVLSQDGHAISARNPGGK